MSADSLATEQINQDVLHFARLATVSRIHAAVLSVFVGRCKNCGFSLEELGKRLGKSANAIGVILNSPEEWSLDTVSDLLLAMECELNVQIREILFTAQRQQAEEAQP